MTETVGSIKSRLVGRNHRSPFPDESCTRLTPARQQLAENMNAGSSPDGATGHTEPPLWSIGLAVVVILIVPFLLYSLAPTGPLREGDTVFSDGRQRVHLMKLIAGSALQQQDTCLLDPGNPVIIIQRPTDRTDGTILAQVQGNQAIEWPFCPPHAEVRLDTHQISQRPKILNGVREILPGLIGR